MNRLRAKAGNPGAFAALMAFALALCGGASARAQQPPPAKDFWFAGTRLVFEHPQIQANGTVSIATTDGGLLRFLAKLGATVAYQPGQKYVVVTSGDRRTIAFAIGDTRFTVAGVAQSAALAPYVVGATAYLPFLDLARALYVDPVADGFTTVLQPQIAALDERSVNRVTIVTLKGASPLHFKRLSDAGDDRVSLAFTGTGSTLARDRRIPSTVLRNVSIAVTGPPKNPTTVVEFDAVAGNVHALGPSDSPSGIVVAFAPAGTVLGGATIPPAGDGTLASTPLAGSPPGGSQQSFSAPGRESNAPPSPPAPAGMTGAGNAAVGVPLPLPTATDSASAPLATAAVTGVVTRASEAVTTVDVALSGAVNYEWHRLPDNRWYVDFKPATLATAPQNIQVGSAALTALRLKGFVGPTDGQPTVRLAFSLASPRAISVAATDRGVSIAVERPDDASLQRSGAGQYDNGRLAQLPAPLPAASPQPPAEMTPNPLAAWKFAPAAGTSGRLIVIDAGHGGSDYGAMHNGLIEKQLNLDVAHRLQAVLVARGWLVKMTRDTDVDVYQPNDSAHDELQARCDVANAAGARLFISVHTNSFTSSSLNGTTVYYYKNADYRFADAVHARLAASLPVKDDGIRKENFYVIHHTTMPAILVEMAFLSNPVDAEALRSPAFLQKIALGIADGVGDYAQGAPPVSTTSSGADGQ